TTRHGRLWTAEELKILELGWGEFTVETLARRLGRRPQGVTTKAFRMSLGGATERSGLLSVYRIMQRTGYSQSRIRIAAAKLGLDPRGRPSPRGGRTSVLGYDEDQIVQIESFLASVPDGQRIYANPNRSVTGEW